MWLSGNYLNFDSFLFFSRFLCETIRNFVELVGVASASEHENETDTLSDKCDTLQHKLSLLLRTLQIESEASTFLKSLDSTHRSSTMDNLDLLANLDNKKMKWHSDSELASDTSTKSNEDVPLAASNQNKKSSKQKVFIPKDHLWSRANSLKKAMREIIDHTERGKIKVCRLKGVGGTEGVSSGA